LRGLTIVGAGGANGITFNSGGVLNIQNCVIRGLAGDGLHFSPATSASLSVMHSWVGNNGGYGIVVRPTGSASVTAVINGATMQYNGANAYGLSLDALTTTGAISGTATDSVSSDNGGGFIAQANLPGHASLMLVRSVAANNHTGVQAGPYSGGDGVVRMSQV